MGRREGKTVQSHRWWMVARKWHLLDATQQVFYTSEFTECGSMHKIKYNKTPMVRRSGYIVPLLSKKLFAIGNTQGKGKSVFSKRKSLHVSTIPQGKPYDQESFLHVVCCCCLFVLVCFVLWFPFCFFVF